MNSSLFLTTYLVGLLTNAEILHAGMCYLSLSQISKSKLSGTTDAFFFYWYVVYAFGLLKSKCIWYYSYLGSILGHNFFIFYVVAVAS